MSKNHKGKGNTTKDSFIDSKLKESKELNNKHNTIKDIEVISRNYMKSNLSKNNTDLTNTKLSKQNGKLNIEDKNDNEDENENEKKSEKGSEKESEKENEKEQLTDRIKENLPNWNERGKFIDKIKSLEEKIIQINKEHSDNIQKYIDEIDKKEKDIKKLVNSNNNLKNSLEVLTQRLDRILVNSNQQKIKLTKVINTNQEDLQHQLDIKEKELKNQQQLINILTKDNKNIRNMLNTLNNYGINEKNINLTEKI